MKAAPLLSVTSTPCTRHSPPPISPSGKNRPPLISLCQMGGSILVVGPFFRLYPKIGTFLNIGIQGGAYTSQSKFLGERRKSVQLGRTGCFSFDRCRTSTAGPILTNFERIVSYSLLVHFEARI